MASVKQILFLLLIIGSIQAKSAQWPDSLKTAHEVNYLTPFEKEIIFELNKLRSNPAKYADESLKDLLHAYQGKTLTYPGQVPIITREGEKALTECIRVLKNSKPLPLFIPSEGLTAAAHELVKEQEKNGEVGHIGRKGSTPKSRVGKVGNWSGQLGENIAYGSGTPFMIIANLLIDDGVPDRGHRLNMLNENYRTIGISTGTHPVYRQVCIMDFATSFENKE